MEPKGKNNTVIEKEKLQIIMSRVFDAPRELVWKLFTDPTQIPNWWGPRYLTTTVEKMDMKVGGTWRFIQQDKSGNEFAFNGKYIEIKEPELIRNTFEFEPLAGHILTETVRFEEIEGKTKVTTMTKFDNIEDLEGMVASGMESGAIESWDRLEEILAK